MAQTAASGAEYDQVPGHRLDIKPRSESLVHGIKCHAHIFRIACHGAGNASGCNQLLKIVVRSRPHGEHHGVGGDFFRAVFSLDLDPLIRYFKGLGRHAALNSETETSWSMPQRVVLPKSLPIFSII